MKKIFFTTSFLLFCLNFASAQTDGNYDFNDFRNLERSDVGRIRHYSERTTNVKGTPYLYDDFRECILVTSKSSKIRAMGNINIHNQEFVLRMYEPSPQSRMITPIRMDTMQVFVPNPIRIQSVLFWQGRDTIQFNYGVVESIFRYVQVVYKTERLQVHFLPKKSFKKADFVDNGITQRGQLYDEFFEQNTYLFQVQGRKHVLTELKRKPLSKVFPNKKGLIEQFFKTQKVRELNQPLLLELLQQLEKKQESN